MHKIDCERINKNILNHEYVSMLSSLIHQKSTVKEVIDPLAELTAACFLNGHGVKLPYKYFFLQ